MSLLQIPAEILLLLRGKFKSYRGDGRLIRRIGGLPSQFDGKLVKIQHNRGGFHAMKGLRKP